MARYQPKPSRQAEFSSYLEGKRVVIVGPAASLNGRQLGSFIDSHDVVVRLNRDCPIKAELYAKLYPGKPLPKIEDKGSRTDVLYHVLYDQALANISGWDHSPQQVAIWQADGVRFLVTRQEPNHPRINRYMRLTKNIFPPVVMDRALRRRLKDATGTNPNTGVIAIAHLLGMPIQSLHVTGFDFYASGYATGMGGMTEEQAAKGVGGRGGWGQSPRFTVPHRQDGQKRYLAELYAREPRLSFDEVATEGLGLTKPKQSVTALVPIKEHSERVPGKNMRMLCGKPLLFWTLAALHEARHVARVVVDTDSEVVANLVREYHPRTVILMRPERLHGGAVTSTDLLEWELSQVDGEHFLQTHVTNPLLTPGTIDRAIQTYFEDVKTYDSLFAVTEHRFRLFDKRGEAVNHSAGVLQRSQDLEPLFEDNSNAYIFSRKSFAAAGGRIGKKPQMFPMSKLEAVDIDYEDDFLMAEAVMRLRNA